MNVFIESILFSIILFSAVFVLAQILKNNSIIDIFWGLSFASLTLYLLLKEVNVYRVVVLVLAMLWGLRLSYYILRRNKKVEDFRYKKFRETWGKYFPLKAFFRIFMLQAFLMYLIALPLIQVNSAVLEIEWLFYLGIVIWMIGYLFEVLSDYQMRQFKKTNKGLIDVGLWKYSRHPNYFGEVVIWVGMFIIGLAFGGKWWLIISPATIFSVFMFISIPMLEKKYDDRVEYQEYKRRTSMFFPMRRK